MVRHACFKESVPDPPWAGSTTCRLRAEADEAGYASVSTASHFLCCWLEWRANDCETLVKLHFPSVLGGM